MFGRLHVWPTTKLSSEQEIDDLIKHNEIIEPYKFQHMVDMQALLLYNTRKIRDELMIPWVKCALTSDCIEPIGAQGKYSFEKSESSHFFLCINIFYVSI